MNSNQDETEVLQFDFSATEGNELAVLLETLLFAADPEIDLGTLEGVHEKLCDEMFLAQWKREHVSLDLSTTELVELNKALLHAGGSTLADSFQLTGELRCCLIATPSVDRVYRSTSWA